MKFIIQCTIALLSLFAAMNAQATPLVGDRAVFNVTLTDGSRSAQGTVTFELLNFEVATDSWTQRTTTEFDGDINVEENEIATRDLLTDAMIDVTLANCAAQGGTIDTITVPAGLFPACAVPVDNGSGRGTVWVAKIPFGYAKWVANRADGVVVSGELLSYFEGHALEYIK